MIFRKSKPSPAHNNVESVAAVSSPAVEPSYLGPDTAFEGNIVCDGEIHIDCEFRGSVQAVTCLVDVNGHVQGSISAQYVVVRGRVIGPITARQLTISKGAHVEGDVMHHGLSIEQGAFVMGTITQEMMRAEAEPQAATRHHEDPEILPALPGKN